MNNTLQHKPDDLVPGILAKAVRFSIFTACILTVLLGALVISSYVQVSKHGRLIASAARAPEEVQNLVGGPLFVMLSLPVSFLIITLAIQSILSFRKPIRMIGKLCLAIFLSVLLTLTPSFIRILSNTTQAGSPRVLRPANPETDRWYAPDGTPILYVSHEANGRMRFWRELGHTPDTRIPTQPVSELTRAKFESQLAEQARLRQMQSEREAAARRLQEESERARREDARRREAAEAERRRFMEAKNHFAQSWQTHYLNADMHLNVWNLDGCRWFEVDVPTRFGVLLGNSHRETMFSAGRHLIELNGVSHLRIRHRSGSYLEVKTRTITEFQMNHFVQNQSSSQTR